jgi:hypothetical protein
VENRLKNKGVLKLTQEKKVDELYEIMKTKKKIISQKDKEILFSDGSPMGSFWDNCKSNKKCDNQTYDKLLKNEILEKDYAKNVENKLKNKGVTPLKIQ